MRAARDFQNVQDYVADKFSRHTAPMKLITSLSEKDTINGKNAVVVMAKTPGLSKLLAKTLGSDSLKVLSESTEETAAIAMLEYFPAFGGSEGYSPGATLPFGFR